MREMIYKSTKHAAKRAKERVGISKKIADENAIRAHQNGVPAKDIGGGLRRYLDSLYLRSKSINEIVVSDFTHGQARGVLAIKRSL